MTAYQKRVATGFLGAAALIALILFGGGIGIFVFTSALSLLMIDEFARIVFSLPDLVEKRYVLLCITWFVALGAMLLAHSEF